MKVLKRIAYAISAIIALILVGGLFLPSMSHVERSVLVDAQPAQVFDYLNDFRKFNEWSPWAGLDPDTVYTFEGPITGVGAVMHWSSEDPSVGKGTQTIIQSERPRVVVTHLDLGTQGESTATFQLDSVDGATRVTWMLDSDFGWNILFRYFGAMMDKLVGASYEEGLNNLKAIVEGPLPPG